MANVIAKKYVKALLASVGQKGLQTAYNRVLPIKEAFKNRKLIAILSDSEIKKGEKEAFVLSLLQKPDEKLTNFIKILAEHDRLMMLPEVVEEMGEELARLKNEYQGVVLSDFKIKANDLKEIESKLNEKLGAKIKLRNEVGSYPGVKVEIDALGVEVGFSTERLKSQIAAEILKTI